MPGMMDFEFRMAGNGRPSRVETSPFILMVLGDFGGNVRRPEDQDPALLLNTPVRKCDIDSIDQLWNIFQPRLTLDIEGAVVEFEPRDLEDFHPDQLYTGQPLFRELRKLRSRLLDPASSAEALAEVLASAPPAAADAGPDVPEAAPSPGESGEGMFARLLGERRAAPAPVAAAQSGVDQLLQRVVGPYIIREPDPKVDTAVESVDQAIAASMRKILHHPAFQQLEGAWRALYDLVYGTETGEELQIKVCSLPKQALLAGLPESAEKLADCGLYELLVGRFRRAADDEGFSLLACNYEFGGSLDDVTLLSCLGTLAEAHQAAVIASALSELIGSVSLARQPAASDWSPLENPFWQQLRESPVAERIGLVMPRVLGRLPYGRETEEIDSFEFEELEARAHENFLWVNATLACAKLLAEAFTQFGWSMQPGSHTDIGGLPAYSYREDGEMKMMPCAELLLPERSAEAILERGIMPIVSFRNRDMARLLRFQSIAQPLAALAGPWEVD